MTSLAISGGPSPQVAWDALRTELYRFVARRVPAADADDVVQEALLRIHRGLPKLREHGAVLGWLYQVTRNALADHLRGARPVAELADEPESSLPDLPEATDAAFCELASCVAPFVAMLPSPYREALEAVELNGASQVAAAAQAGIPLSTMKSRVQRGRAALRAQLEQCCAIDLDVRGHVVDVTPRDRCSCRQA